MTEKLTNLQAAELDAKSIYIGNLRTIEFDLKLPSEGENGSKIDWTSSEDRWITSEGKVTRPDYGRNNREVKLTATVTNGDASVTREFDVTVFQEDNTIEVKKIYLIELHEGVGKRFYLPSAVAVETTGGKAISHSAVWDEDTEQLFDQPGHYETTGKLSDTDYEIKAEMIVDADFQDILNLDKKFEPFNLNDVELKPG